MVSEFPAGLSRSDLELILQHDEDIVSVERIASAQALWRVSCSVDGQQPVEVLIDNGINDIYVQALIQIDTDHIVEALRAVESIGVTGLALMNDMLFIRSGFFIEHSTMHAFTNAYRAAVFAYQAYQRALQQSATASPS